MSCPTQSRRTTIGIIPSGPPTEQLLQGCPLLTCTSSSLHWTHLKGSEAPEVPGESSGHSRKAQDRVLSNKLYARTEPPGAPSAHPPAAALSRARVRLLSHQGVVSHGGSLVVVKEGPGDAARLASGEGRPMHGVPRFLGLSLS